MELDVRHMPAVPALGNQAGAFQAEGSLGSRVRLRLKNKERQTEQDKCLDDYFKFEFQAAGSKVRWK